jgi:oligosaccharide repeat unit polymerase
MIFSIIYIILFFSLLSLFFLRTKRFFSLGSLFIFIWTLLPIISNMGLINVPEPSIQTNLLVIFSIFVFSCLYILFSKKSIKSIYKSSFSLRFRNFIVLIDFIIITFSISYIERATLILNQFGFDYLRLIATQNTELLFETTALRAFIDLFIFPFIVFQIIYVVSNLSLKTRFDLLLTFLTIILSFIYSFIFAARSILVRILILSVFGLLFFKTLSKLNFKSKFIISSSFMIVLIFIVYITVNRGDPNFSFIDNILIYYGGPLSLLNNYIENPIQSSLNEFFYGGVLFGFIFNIISLILTFIFGIQYFGTDHLISLITSIPIKISNTISLNAIPSSIYYFYRDFGLLGIFLGFSILSILSSFLEHKVFIKKDLYFVLPFLTLSYVIFESFQNYELISPSYFFLFICFSFFIKRSKYEPKNF